jgi:ATP-dependent Clp protease adaptor protein ClpS
MPRNEGTGTGFATRREEKLKEPEEYRVVLLNDNYTTMEFVVLVLMSVFQKPATESNRIMLDVHKKGRGMVGVYPWDIATTKVEQVHQMARKESFPLRCVVEKA